LREVFQMEWNDHRKTLVREALRNNNGKIRMQHAFQIYSSKNQAKQTIQAMEAEEIVHKDTPGVFKINTLHLPEDKFPNLDLDKYRQKYSDKTSYESRKDLQAEKETEQILNISKDDDLESKPSKLGKLVRRIKKLFR